jgi:hypothetical protein
MESLRLDQQVILVTPVYRMERYTNVLQNEEAICWVTKNDEYICTVSFTLYGELKDNTLQIEFPVKNGQMDLVREGYGYKIKAYGLTKIGPGTWKVEPRIEQNPIHAHVVLCNVPEPAPWEDGVAEQLAELHAAGRM